jgi:uncharacterized membrane protein SpoIIM required for sporulation
MANVVIKKYACDHNELLTDRISYVVNDIETFLSMALISPAATMFVSFSGFFLSFFYVVFLVSLEQNQFHRQQQQKKKRKEKKLSQLIIKTNNKQTRILN